MTTQNRWRRVLLVLASALAATLTATGTSSGQSRSDWTEPFPPFRIAGNLYYVGSRGLANYLITTPRGHILINSDLESSVPLIRTSVEKLGFKFSDIRILLISHAHWDHDAGSAAIKRLTGAKYMVMDADVPVVESGGKADFFYGNQPASLYPPAKVDRVLHDGEEVKLGDVTLVAHLTPGHTKGCTTWTMKVSDAGKLRDVVIVGSPNVNDGYRLVSNPSYPGIASDYERTFRVLKSLPVDFFLGAHGDYFDLKTKYARLRPGAENPFIDPAGYRKYVADREEAFRRELAKQTVAPPVGAAKSLFNGRDLSGWHVDVPADSNVRVRNPFVVRNGMLVSLGEPRGHLITDSSYRDYRLEVEYRFSAAPGNAGILVHASTPRALYGMFPRSIEVQMEHGNAGDFWCILEDIRVSDMERRRGPPAQWGTTEGKARRILNLTDSSENPLGQWNTMVIEAIGRSIKVWVNGDLVNEGSDATADHGQIAVQSEGSEVEFRKLSLTPIERPLYPDRGPVKLYDPGSPAPAGTRIAIQVDNEPPIVQVSDGRGGPPFLYHGQPLDPNRLKSIVMLKTKEAREKFGDQTLDVAILIELKTESRPVPPTRDPHAPGYVAAKELPDGANAPSDADGNFIIGPTHTPARETLVHDGVPRGTVHTFTIRSEDSKIFPGIARDSGTFGTVSPTDPAILIVTTSHPAPYTRTVAVYVPAQYVPGTAAPFIVGADGPDPMLFTTLDNLIAEKRVPVMIAISIGNGGGDAQGSERALEYDTMSPAYANFVETEVLPLVEQRFNVKLTKDPNGRATMGGSSGGSAAFIMAWYRPDLYRRVLAYSITAINQQWPHNPETPHGAWGFHETLIPNSPAKPIRVWLEVGDKDFLHPNIMRDGMHDWVIASENMAKVLAAKGYHYQFVFARNAVHVDRAVKAQTLPGALEWLWKGYR